MERYEVSAREIASPSALEFEIERLTSALNHLRPALDQAREREEQAEADAFRAEVTAERDALANDIVDKYEVSAREIASLLTRMTANNARVEAVNRLGRGPRLKSAEDTVRGAYVGMWTLASGVRLPPLNPSAHAGGSFIWPLPEPPRDCMTPQLRATMAAIGAEARRIGQEVTAREQAKAKAGRRRR